MATAPVPMPALMRGRAALKSRVAVPSMGIFPTVPLIPEKVMDEAVPVTVAPMLIPPMRPAGR